MIKVNISYIHYPLGSLLNNHSRKLFLPYTSRFISSSIFIKGKTPDCKNLENNLELNNPNEKKINCDKIDRIKQESAQNGTSTQSEMQKSEVKLQLDQSFLSASTEEMINNQVIPTDNRTGNKTESVSSNKTERLITGIGNTTAELKEETEKEDIQNGIQTIKPRNKIKNTSENWTKLQDLNLFKYIGSDYQTNHIIGKIAGKNAYKSLISMLSKNNKITNNSSFTEFNPFDYDDYLYLLSGTLKRNVSSGKEFKINKYQMFIQKNAERLSQFQKEFNGKHKGHSNSKFNKETREAYKTLLSKLFNNIISECYFDQNLETTTRKLNTFSRMDEKPGFGSLVQFVDNSHFLALGSRYPNVLNFGLVINEQKTLFNDLTGVSDSGAKGNFNKSQNLFLKNTIPVLTIDKKVVDIRPNQISFQINSFFDQHKLYDIISEIDNIEKAFTFRENLLNFLIMFLVEFNLLASKMMNDIDLQVKSAFDSLSNESSINTLNLAYFMVNLPFFKNNSNSSFILYSYNFFDIPILNAILFYALHLSVINNPVRFLHLSSPLYLPSTKANNQSSNSIVQSNGLINYNYYLNTSKNVIWIKHAMQILDDDKNIKNVQHYVDLFLVKYLECIWAINEKGQEDYQVDMNSVINSVFISDEELQYLTSIITLMKYYVMYPHYELGKYVKKIVGPLLVYEKSRLISTQNLNYLSKAHGLFYNPLTRDYQSSNFGFNIKVLENITDSDYFTDALLSSDPTINEDYLKKFNSIRTSPKTVHYFLKLFGVYDKNSDIFLSNSLIIETPAREAPAVSRLQIDAHIKALCEQNYFNYSVSQRLRSKKNEKLDPNKYSSAKGANVGNFDFFHHLRSNETEIPTKIFGLPSKFIHDSLGLPSYCSDMGVSLEMVDSRNWKLKFYIPDIGSFIAPNSYLFEKITQNCSLNFEIGNEFFHYLPKNIIYQHCLKCKSHREVDYSSKYLNVNEDPDSNSNFDLLFDWRGQNITQVLTLTYNYKNEIEDPFRLENEVEIKLENIAHSDIRVLRMKELDEVINERFSLLNKFGLLNSTNDNFEEEMEIDELTRQERDLIYQIYQVVLTKHEERTQNGNSLESEIENNLPELKLNGESVTMAPNNYTANKVDIFLKELRLMIDDFVARFAADNKIPMLIHGQSLIGFGNTGVEETYNNEALNRLYKFFSGHYQKDSNQLKETPDIKDSENLKNFKNLTYSKNLKAFIHRTTDKWTKVSEKVPSLSEDGREVVTSHSIHPRYFATSYEHFTLCKDINGNVADVPFLCGVNYLNKERVITDVCKNKDDYVHEKLGLIKGYVKLSTPFESIETLINSWQIILYLNDKFLDFFYGYQYQEKYKRFDPSLLKMKGYLKKYSSSELKELYYSKVHNKNERLMCLIDYKVKKYWTLYYIKKQYKEQPDLGWSFECVVLNNSQFPDYSVGYCQQLGVDVELLSLNKQHHLVVGDKVIADKIVKLEPVEGRIVMLIAL
ncbi:uncharacterized protein ASCRUDRAFT_7215 [Ascoidea rubescens DSM 1968]|uniref:RNB-domain-containing protein n=1 Tax=Ascoidea rubescens DSM 1968 TaxID=1344418 RepID=A0A1D2VM43_9ASCO|nr:hypothetical protein ASCRUDRAFT_7215 [Ascoidea rubescens DSM 1968]ODV62686.1 hypothetical protein ASCRUDRAFT_7215 [Ascoidea rubescens DSM 1968]